MNGIFFNHTEGISIYKTYFQLLENNQIITAFCTMNERFNMIGLITKVVDVIKS